MPRRGGLMCRSTATRGGASCDAGTLPKQGARIAARCFEYSKLKPIFQISNHRNPSFNGRCAARFRLVELLITLWLKTAKVLCI